MRTQNHRFAQNIGLLPDKLWYPKGSGVQNLKRQKKKKNIEKEEGEIKRLQIYISMNHSLAERLTIT